MKPADIPFQPWAKQLSDRRQDGRDAKIESDATCLPASQNRANPVPYKSVWYFWRIAFFNMLNLWRGLWTAAS